MKLRTTLIATTVTLLLNVWSLPAFADDSLGQIPAPPATIPVVANTARPATTPAAPSLAAKGAVLIDAFSGKVLASVNPDQRMAPASLTKIMTAYIISENIRSGRLHMTDMVHISERAWRTGGSKMFIKVNDEVAVNDLLQGIIVDSGNDACIAMAEHLAGSEEAFSELMNQQAKALGMNNTHFTDATGMPHANHYTTPRDMAVLARALVFNYPEDYKWYSQKWFTYNKIKQPNRNRLLWRDTAVDGIKTGHTDEAGFCLVASAQKNGTRLISVVMGEPTDSARADDSQKLLNFGFRFFETHPIFTANTPVDKVRVWMGKQHYTPIGVNQVVYLTTPAGQFHNVKTVVETVDLVTAPVNKNQTIGQIKVYLNNEEILSQPAIALNENPKAGIFSRLRDQTHLAMRKLFGNSSATLKTDGK